MHYVSPDGLHAHTSTRQPGHTGSQRCSNPNCALPTTTTEPTARLALLLEMCLTETHTYLPSVTVSTPPSVQLMLCAIVCLEPSAPEKSVNWDLGKVWVLF